MTTNLLPTLTGQGRIFINVDGPGCSNPYKYYGCMKLDSVDKSFGDITPIYCPSNTTYDEFVEIGSVKGADSRATSTLTGILPINEESALEVLGRAGCGFNLQVHYGRCTRPDKFAEFDSAVIFEDVRLTSYGLSTLTARTPDERASVEETAAISIGNFYRVFNVKESNVGLSGAITNASAIFGVAHLDSKNCGGACSNKSDGCSVWLAGRRFTANGDIQIAYTDNAGVTWTTVDANLGINHTGAANEITMLTTTESTYIALVAAGDLYVMKVDNAGIFNNTASGTLLIGPLTDYVIYDMAESDNYIWLVGGETGDSLIYAINKTTDEVITIDEGGLSTNELYGIGVYNDDNIVVTGDNGVVLRSTTFGSFSLVSSGSNTRGHDAYLISENDILVAHEDGIFCTGNNGETWNTVVQTTGVTKLDFYDSIVGYARDNINTYRTIDSGNTWSIVASNAGNNANDVVACPFNPNSYMIGGQTFVLRGSN